MAMNKCSALHKALEPRASPSDGLLFYPGYLFGVLDLLLLPQPTGQTIFEQFCDNYFSKLISRKFQIKGISLTGIIAFRVM